MIEQANPIYSDKFVQEMQAVIARWSLLKHPFYEMWNRGELTLQALREYAKQYYAHVQAFPTYLSAVHSRCQDMAARQVLLENLIDEERGAENHPELWLRFAEGLGVSREEVRSAGLLPETVASVNALKRLTCSDRFIEGVAALYAYESQVPEVARSKREGLAKFYGIEDARAVSYFSVHEQADVEHSEGEVSLLLTYCNTEDSRRRAIEAAEQSAKAMWNFLDGIYASYVA